MFIISPIHYSEHQGFPQPLTGYRKPAHTEMMFSTPRNKQGWLCGKTSWSCGITTQTVGTLRKSTKYAIITHNMPKRTHQPHTRHRAKTHGFRARIATKAGRAVIKRRRSKGRARIAI